MNWTRWNEPPSTAAVVLIVECLREPRHALDQHVTAGEQADEHPLQHLLLPGDDAPNLEERLFQLAADLFHGRLLVRFVTYRMHRFPKNFSSSSRSVQCLAPGLTLGLDLRPGELRLVDARRRRRARPGRPRARPPRAPSSRARRRPRPGTPSRSAWNCIRKPFADAPPSARSTAGRSGSASTTSATWWAIASSAARTRWARVVPRVIPATRPRASASHHGEPRPVSAGTKVTPPVEATLARAPRSRPRRRAGRGRRAATAAAAPLDEHRALERVAVGGGRLEQAVRRRRRVVARVHEHEAAGAVGRLALARRVAALPVERRLLVARDAADRQRAHRAARPPPPPRRSARSAAAARGRRRRARAARRPSRASRSETSSVREAFVTSVTCASPPVSFQTSHVSTVPKARPSRVRARAAATRAWSPRSTDRGRDRCARGSGRRSSSRQRSAVRRSCQTIAGATGRRRSRGPRAASSRAGS